MALDIFKGIRLTPGQEVRAQDIKDLQNYLLSRVLDGMLERLVPGPMLQDKEAGSRILFNGAHGANVPSNEYAYALACGGAYPRQGSANNKIQIAPGTLFQKVGTSDGNEPTFLPYTFPGTDEVTIASGDATNPRIDLVEMKLQLVDDDSQARVTATAGIKASRDLNPSTTNCETVIRARAAGFGGNAISIQFIADGSGVGSLTQSGYALVFHYQSGVTTVANFETAVAASSLIEVQTTDGVGTLASPGDTFGPVFLTGGTDQVLSSSSLLMKRRVQMTLQVKQGTPAATPAYPTNTSGFVTIAAIFVPQTWVSASGGVVYHDVAGTSVLVLHDQRMPLGTPRVYRAMPREFIAINDGSHWSLVNTGTSVTSASSGAGEAWAQLPTGSGAGEGSAYGRLLAVEIATNNNSGTSARLARMINASGSFSTIDLANLTGLQDTAANLIADRLGSDGFETLRLGSGPDITANSLMGPPVWTNGRRGIIVPNGTDDMFDQESLIVRFPQPSGTNEVVYSVNFIVAEGL